MSEKEKYPSLTAISTTDGGVTLSVELLQKAMDVMKEAEERYSKCMNDGHPDAFWFKGNRKNKIAYLVCSNCGTLDSRIDEPSV